MSEQHHDFPKTTASQVIVATLGGLIAPALIIFLVVKLLLGIQATHIDDADPATAAVVVAERIKPVAQVEVAAANSGPHIDKSGEEVVGAVCSACHGSGALGSPKIGDKAAWGPRIKQGYETLIQHALAGIRQMPARGGNPDLTDGEIANAVAYMANKGGANFTPLVPAAAETAAPVATSAVEPMPAKPAEKVAASKDAAMASPSPAAKQEPVVQPAPTVENKPVVEAQPAASAGKSGEEVVKAVCSVCHAAGVLGSPKIGDKEAWAPRIAQGYETLIQHAINGIRVMPAKGGNPALSDAEVARAVAYMANQAGANFTPPAAK